MRKLAYILVASFVLSCSSIDTYQFNLENWPKDKNFNFWIERTDVDLHSNEIQDYDIILSKFIIKLDSIYMDSASIKWTFQFLKYIPDSLRSDFLRMTGDSLEIESEIEIQYTIDNQGSFLRIYNWDDIRMFYDKKWDSQFKDEIKNSPLSNAELDSIKKLFINDNYLKEKITQPIKLFHQLFGIEIFLNTQKNYFDCEYCDSNGLVIENLMSNERFIKLRVYNKLDNNKISDFLWNNMYGLGGLSDFNTAMSVVDTVYYSFDRDLGIPIHIKSKRTIENQNKKKQILYSIKIEE